MVKRYAAVLNAGAGTIRGRDPQEIVQAVERTFSEHGHEIDVTLTEGPSIRAAIEKHARRKDLEALIVGGGDGTVSTAASLLQGTDMLLGVLPLGTMNLFARSLKVPLVFEEALPAVAAGRPAKADIGLMNGRPFVHQVSFGLQPKLVTLRESMQYGARAGKILASLRAFLIALRSPPVLALKCDIDGKPFSIETPALAVSNNLYGAGHLPYADDIDGGVLGVYALTSSHWRDIAQASADATLGNWHSNPQIKIFSAREVTVERRHGRAVTISVDGELLRIAGAVRVEIKPQALNVILPVAAEPASGGATA
ncbi:MAG: diacylglycerol kinase family protein [Parvibaculaceae bacterium]